MALKVIHKEILKFIGFKVKTLDDIYDHISGSKKFSKLGINQVNFGEAMGKLERLSYIREKGKSGSGFFTLTSLGVKIHLKIIDKMR